MTRVARAPRTLSVFRVTPYDARGERPYSWQYTRLAEARRCARTQARVNPEYALVVERGVWMVEHGRRVWTPTEMWSLR